MSEVLKQKVVGVRWAPCRALVSKRHPVLVRLASGGDVGAADAIDLMGMGGVFYMVPPRGAPAYEAHMATGRPLLLGHRRCDKCGEEVLFA